MDFLHKFKFALQLAAFLFLLATVPATAQPATGSIHGKVTLAGSNEPIHEALLTSPQLRRVLTTDENGDFVIDGLPAGKYDLVAHLGQLSDARQTVIVEAGKTAFVRFELGIRPVREHINVTATGTQATASESLQIVASLESTELITRMAPSLGGALDEVPGVNRRSFGPGNERPVIRGFDGDRVLVLQDGIPTGSMSSSSGDHGEPINIASAERVEIIRGPATLLYGSNAIGGVVNVIGYGNHLHAHQHQTLSGNVAIAGGSADALLGGSAGFEYGHKGWLLWGGGGGQRTGDYQTPVGRIFNSAADSRNTYAGFGRYTDKTYFNFEYTLAEGDYGVPFAGEFHSHLPNEEYAGQDHPEHEGEAEKIGIGWRRNNVRGEWGLTRLPRFADNFTLVLNHSDWNHREMENGTIGTEFFNKQTIYRGAFDQKRFGLLSGTFGFWGMHRNFKAFGEEALAPPTDQNAFALFALEDLNLDRAKFQFGGRIERNQYQPAGLRDRDFLSLSAAAGVSVPLPAQFLFSTSFSHASRAPGLEELYNDGPHVGNLTYEIGNPALEVERANGIESSIRKLTERFHLEASVFLYDFSNFIFLAPTGEHEGGLPRAEYLQGDARFYGVDGRIDFETARNLWMKIGFDAVNATLTDLHTGLPRIPPMRSRIGIEYRPGRFSFAPELSMGSRQSHTYFEETPTAGYVVANFRASYALATSHNTHIFSVDAFNLGNTLWRNHLSFIKDLAPEIGRGIRFGYTLRFF
ncbi:MAG: TonB-dependent receptor [Bryobacterales bacterium]|nr:TonB-dependent receptor [Bryobacterales bacterium]